MILKRIHITALLLVIISISPKYCYSQEVINERNYEGEALYGYMNGGSDLFLEYGFKKLTVKNIIYNNFSYSMEIFQMDTPVDAFGIYSIHLFKPLKVDYLIKGGFVCLSKYQLQCAYGNEYISIVFNDGEVAASGAETIMTRFVEAKEGYSQKVEGSIPDFIPKEFLLNSEIPLSGNLKYVKGELGLSNAADDVFEQYPKIGIDYNLWIYHYKEELKYLTIKP